MRKMIYIFILILLTSCGARKSAVKTEDIKVEQTTTVKEEVSEKIETNETKVDTSTIEEIYYEPIDSSKSFIVNGKEYKNVRFKATKTKKGITTAKKEESVLNQTKETLNEVSMDIETKDKEADRKESFGSWIWLFIIVGIILMYLEYRKK